MIEFTLNGQKVSLDVDPEMPLLWAIRDETGLTGTKFGCGIGMCGACTVHVGGRPTRSCITPIKDVAGAEITTIEGLDPKGEHPVQVAWRALQVPQCGYCQSGQIMTAVALLASNSAPTSTEIDTAMSGNLCRCGTYPRIREAVQSAATALAGGAK